MSKEINIDNEEQILKECDFDYYYHSENCSRELCMFYNDISKQNTLFNKQQARIDLGRIGITLNKQAQRIAELEDRWDKFKEWIMEQNNPINNLIISNDETKYLYMSDILDEMEELDKGE